MQFWGATFKRRKWQVPRFGCRPKIFNSIEFGAVRFYSATRVTLEFELTLLLGTFIGFYLTFIASFVLNTATLCCCCCCRCRCCANRTSHAGEPIDPYCCTRYPAAALLFNISLKPAASQFDVDVIVHASLRDKVC